MSEPIKIGYVLGSDADDAIERRLLALRTRVDSTITLEPINVAAAMNVRGWTPGDSAAAHGAYVRAFKDAEVRGCQAVVPDGMLDLGVGAGRSEVQIPVVAPFQSTLHVAACVGTRIGVIQYTAAFIPQLWESVRRYSMSDFVVNIRPLGFEMVDLYDELDLVKEHIVRAARRLLDEDAADVIVPTGPGLCPVAVDPKWLSIEINAPVIEGMGAPLEVAATLVRLGLRQSGVRWPSRRR